MSAQSGRIFSIERSTIWALNDEGRIAPVANYKFNSREGRDLVRVAARQLGIKERPPKMLTMVLISSLSRARP